MAMRFYRKARGGTNTVELAPMLFVLICVILIPMLDFLYLALAYADCWLANHLAVREACCTADPPQPPLNRSRQQAADGATTAWQGFGLGKFVKASGISNTIADGPDEDGDTKPDSITVSTNITIQPFLHIPFLTSVAGINAPITYRFAASRPVEEKGIK